jgi:DtxR family Mn-dependent transcriptional regulator
MIYREQHEGSREIRTTTIAKSLGVRPATVTGVLENLSKKKLIRHRPYRGIELTKDGVAEAQKLLRKHRILEVLLVDILGYGTQRACDEASKLDYYASRDLINGICRAYEHPEVCPCGKTIFRDPKCNREVNTN